MAIGLWLAEKRTILRTPSAVPGEVEHSASKNQGSGKEYAPLEQAAERDIELFIGVLVLQRVPRTPL